MLVIGIILDTVTLDWLIFYRFYWIISNAFDILNIIAVKDSP